MLQIVQFTFNPFSENTYLLINDAKQCWIVDPGMYGTEEEQVLIKYIEDNELKPQKIINTHTHIDHIFGVDAIKQKYNIPFIMHTNDIPVLNGASGSAMLFGFNFGAAPTPDAFIEHEQILHLGNEDIEVRLAPGHSPGSVVFYYPKGGFVIGGDVLFQHSVGRTDLPGGDTDTLMKSIKEQLYTLPDTTIVYSGHGPVTTIGEEKQVNPFVRG